MAKSIIQPDAERCYLCGGYPAPPLNFLAKHHVFGAASKTKSEKYGLTVYLHNEKCHIYGEKAVHRNAETRRALQAEAQKIAMKKYGWSVEDFREIFHKNYL